MESRAIAAYGQVADWVDEQHTDVEEASFAPITLCASRRSTSWARCFYLQMAAWPTSAIGCSAYDQSTGEHVHEQPTDARARRH